MRCADKADCRLGGWTETASDEKGEPGRRASSFVSGRRRAGPGQSKGRAGSGSGSGSRRGGGGGGGLLGSQVKGRRHGQCHSHIPKPLAPVKEGREYLHVGSSAVQRSSIAQARPCWKNA
jgi:hypothetical protein